MNPTKETIQYDGRFNCHAVADLGSTLRYLLWEAVSAVDITAHNYASTMFNGSLNARIVNTAERILEALRLPPILWPVNTDSNDHTECAYGVKQRITNKRRSNTSE